MNTFNQTRLKQLLHYDPITGKFRWRPRSDRSKGWNRKHAGKLAGWVTGDTHGYERIAIDGSHHYAHRLAVLYMTGKWPKDEVDHINRVRDDNRWGNLREASKSENGRNTGLRKTNTSGIKGVSWDRSRGKWLATICVGRVQTALGRFDTKEEAIAARRAAEARLHGDFAVIRGVA